MYKRSNYNNSINKDCDLDSKFYRHLLGDNTQNNHRVADQRNCVVLSIEAASKSLDNSSLCEFQNKRLNSLSEITNQDGQNTCNTLLQEFYPNINSRRQFTMHKNMPKINLIKYLDDLECYSDAQKLFCVKSEASSKVKMKQFNGFEDSKTKLMYKIDTMPKNKMNLEERFEKLEKLQGFNQNRVLELTVNREVISQKRQEEIANCFTTASDELGKQTSMGGLGSQQDAEKELHSTRSLGMRRNAKSRFVSPLLSSKEKSIENLDAVEEKKEVVDALKNIDPKMVELIMAEIMDQCTKIAWDDIAGLQFVKSAIQEAVVWPLLRPDIFTGLRRPPKGILLFGPPGTGKTLIGKCVASQSKSTFFSISASSLTSKWIGDGEKMVRALFAVARAHQPAVIFIDEVDSLLTQRSDTEHESSRRIKTEFLVQLDGASTDSEERLLLIGATNRPQELDEAARRRFVKRLYIPLPDYEARLSLLKRLVASEKHTLTENQFKEVAKLSTGYSGADIRNLCSEAALGPIRSLGFGKIENIQAAQVRPLKMADFEISLKRVKPSVSQNDLVHYISWNKTYGSCGSLG